MNILALDTSGPVCGVAITRDGGVVYEAAAVNKLTHSVNLLPMVEEGCIRAGLTLSQMDRLAVVAGPGSFTGVRIGISTVKALAHGSEKPCVAIDALEAMAAGIPAFNGVLCPIQDARAGQVYGAAFRAGMPPQRLMEDEPLKIEQYIEKIRPMGEAFLFLGDGVVVHRVVISSLLGEKALFAPAHCSYLRPSSAALLAQCYQDKTVDYLELAPYYLRAPQAERLRLSKEAAHG